jgi:hypothetical protein
MKDQLRPYRLGLCRFATLVAASVLTVSVSRDSVECKADPVVDDAHTYTIRYILFTVVPKPGTIQDAKDVPPFVELNDHHGIATPIGPSAEEFLDLLRSKRKDLIVTLRLAGEAAATKGKACVIRNGPRKGDEYRYRIEDTIYVDSPLPADQRPFLDPALNPPEELVSFRRRARVGWVDKNAAAGSTETKGFGVDSLKHPENTARLRYSVSGLGIQELEGRGHIFYVTCILPGDEKRPAKRRSLLPDRPERRSGASRTVCASSRIS